MRLTIEEIKHLVSSGESSSLELKETTGQLSQGMESGCAFMNSLRGGYLLFGINDKGHITGQEVSDKTKQDIANALKRFEPAIFVDVEYIPVPATNKQVIAIHFEDSSNRKPFLFDGRAYAKIESTTSIMPQTLYNELLVARHKKQFRWEAFPNKDLSIEQLNKDKIVGTIRLGIESGRLPESTFENMDTATLLDKLDLIENGILRNAAAILFIQKANSAYPQCKLRLARFKGINRLEFIDNIQIEGNIFNLFDSSMSFLFKHLSFSGKVVKAEREEELSVPYKALREAIVNALSHRDYTEPGGSVGIAVYDDRVEITNPGQFPQGINTKSLSLPHKSIPNNPLIANVLYKRRMLESWGRGLELIYNECHRVGLPAPIISNENGEVIVTFYLHNQVTEQVTEQVKVLIRTLASREMTIKEILASLELKHRPTLLYDYIQPAMKSGFVEQTQPNSPNSPTQKYRLTTKGKRMT